MNSFITDFIDHNTVTTREYDIEIGGYRYAKQAKQIIKLTLLKRIMACSLGIFALILLLPLYRLGTFRKRLELIKLLWNMGIHGTYLRNTFRAHYNENTARNIKGGSFTILPSISPCKKPFPHLSDLPSELRYDNDTYFSLLPLDLTKYIIKNYLRSPIAKQHPGKIGFNTQPIDTAKILKTIPIKHIKYSSLADKYQNNYELILCENGSYIITSSWGVFFYNSEGTEVRSFHTIEDGIKLGIFSDGSTLSIAHHFAIDANDRVFLPHIHGINILNRNLELQSFITLPSWECPKNDRINYIKVDSSNQKIYYINGEYYLKVLSLIDNTCKLFEMEGHVKTIHHSPRDGHYLSEHPTKKLFRDLHIDENGNVLISAGKFLKLYDATGKLLRHIKMPEGIFVTTCTVDKYGKIHIFSQGENESKIYIIE